MTTKILDTTCISAATLEIQSVDILSRCHTIFEFVITKEVSEEYHEGRGATNMPKVAPFKIEQVDIDSYESIIQFLEQRYPYLHRGELSSYLLALLNYAYKNRKHYLVTDDGLMRESIESLSKDILLRRMLGGKSAKIKLTGTIGLIRRMREKRMLSRSEIEMIISDLEQSTFRCTPSLLRYLRESN